MADSRYIHLLFVAPENDHIDLSNSLKRHDFAVERTGNLSDACQILSDKNESRFDAVLATELAKLPAVAILSKLKKANRDVPIIMVSSDSNSRLAIEMTKFGAYDFFLTPASPEELVDAFKRATEDARRITKPVEIGEVYEEQDTIVGRSRAMREIYKQLGRIATQPVTVLVRGETGTGKELIARAIFQHGHRSHAPFITINCAAIPENLLESELFGHEKGAFTGASHLRVGRFEQADGGTLFLDEIGDLDASLQVKLLRVLQEKTIQRIGGREDIAVDVRIIAATHRPLESMVRKGTFREDLFYRLNVAAITIPPLRERREDIPPLIDYFLKRFAKDYGMELPTIADQAVAFLTDFDWPGNIRQLQNTLSKALINSRGYSLNWIEFRNILESSELLTQQEAGLKTMIDRTLTQAINEEVEAALPVLTEKFEREVFGMAIKRAGGNQAKAARWLGVSRFTLREKLKHFGFHPKP